MSIVIEVTPERKPDALQSCVNELQTLVLSAVREGTAVHEVERQLFQGVLRLGHQLLGRFFALLGDGDQGPQWEVTDGLQLRRLPGPHPREYRSVFGDFTLQRVVYGSREGQRIECVPLATRLGLPAGKGSYLLQEWDQALAVETPFGQVNEVLGRLLGLNQSVASLETMNRQWGAAVERYWEQQAEQEVAVPEPAVVVLSGDGKGVPMRKPADTLAISAHESNQGPQPGRKPMAVVGAVYTIEPYERSPLPVLEALFREPSVPAQAEQDPKRPRPKPLHKLVRASLNRSVDGIEIAASTEVFGWLVAQAEQRDPAHAKPWVVLMDGQISLWNEIQRVVGDTPRVEILDLLHATSHLWEAVHLFHAPGSPLAFNTMKLWVLMVLNGLVESLVIWPRHLAPQADWSASQHERLEKICQYFLNNQARMRYDRYLAAGYPIASGVIEGACRHVVKDRMERAGMHWTVPGAQAMLNVRSVAINKQWEAFLQYHIEQETARLYPYAEVIGQVEWPLAMAA